MRSQSYANELAEMNRQIQEQERRKQETLARIQQERKGRDILFEKELEKEKKIQNQINEKEHELAQTNNVSEKSRLQNEINETKGKVAEEVNATIEAEISAFPKLTARIEMKNISV